MARSREGAVRRFAKLDVDIAIDPDVAELPSDAARYAWVLTICEAKRVGGEWSSSAHYRASLGERSRWLDRFVKEGLLVKANDGTIRPRAYERWQSDLPAAAERMRRYRDRQRAKRGANGERP
jgi:hypothetical protein